MKSLILFMLLIILIAVLVAVVLFMIPSTTIRGIIAFIIMMIFIHYIKDYNNKN